MNYFLNRKMNEQIQCINKYGKDCLKGKVFKRL